MTTDCRLNLLSDDLKREAKFYCILVVVAYVASCVISVVVLACCHYRVVDVRFVGAGAMLPAITRYLIGFAFGRRLAELTGEPGPRISLLRSLVPLGLIGTFIVYPWL